jgi:L-threonine kinase
LANGPHFLITSPIGLFSWAEFEPDPERERVVVEPADRSKSRIAVERYLEELALPLGGRLRIHTPQDPGQGFGTSTADITAALRAAGAAWHRSVPPEVIARVAATIEPTDGSMYPGCVAFAHLHGSLLEHLGQLPRFEALVACTGGVVDTVAFDVDRRRFRYSQRDEAELLRAWDMVRQANRRADVGLMARAATTSARINEQLLKKPLFAELSRFAELSGVDGLMAAHSGTALALVLDPSRPGYHVRLHEAQRFFEGLGLTRWFQVSNGRIAMRGDFEVRRERGSGRPVASESIGGVPAV